MIAQVISKIAHRVILAILAFFAILIKLIKVSKSSKYLAVAVVEWQDTDEN